MKRREKSDRPIVPKNRRKSEATSRETGIGKESTASEDAGQQELFHSTADSLKGNVVRADKDQSFSARNAVPKEWEMKSTGLPAMTIEEVATERNLMEAFKQVASNKGAPGPDRKTIKEIESNLVSLIPKLTVELKSGNYYPGMIRRVWIPKAGGGKRGLGIPNVIDRIVQQAIYQILNPNYDSGFSESSHGFRPGKSCHSAIEEAKSYIEDGYDWVVDIDLEKFFDKVNHQRLLNKLEQRIKDRILITLIKRLLKAKVLLPDGMVVANEEGTPQGGPLSPLLSNIILDELDAELMRRGHKFVRYADDNNIYVRSKRSGHRVMASLTTFIEKKLRLKVNESKSKVAKTEERHFLGFSMRRKPEDGSVEVLLSKRSRDRIDSKVKTLTPRNWGQSLEQCLKGLNQYLIGWIGFFHICTESEYRSFCTVDAHIRRRLRAIILKQLKRKKNIARKLIKLGVKPKTAWKIYKGKMSIWALSHYSPVDRGLNNQYFKDIGLKSIAALWNDWQIRTIVKASGQLKLLF